MSHISHPADVVELLFSIRIAHFLGSVALLKNVMVGFENTKCVEQPPKVRHPLWRHDQGSVRAAPPLPDHVVDLLDQDGSGGWPRTWLGSELRVPGAVDLPLPH